MVDSTKFTNSTSSPEFLLTSQLRECARSLPSQAYEMAKELVGYADNIEALDTRESALQKFDEYAGHYKGLRDCIVPGIRPTDWTKKAKTLSMLSRTAVKARKPLAWWQRWFK